MPPTCHVGSHSSKMSFWSGMEHNEKKEETEQKKLQAAFYDAPANGGK